MEIDACADGIGVVLMQNNMPIAYLSKALSVKNKGLSIYDKEFLALVLAVEKWRPYLQHAEFVIRTDHKVFFLESQVLHTDIQKKPMEKLMGLHFKIVYRKGKDNLAADALSRIGHCMDLQTVSEVKPLWIQEILNSYIIDEEAQQLLANLVIQNPDEQGFSLQQGVIRKGS